MAEYNIKDSDMDADVRRIGSAFRRLRPYQDEEFFRKTNKAEDALVRGKWAPVHTEVEEKFISRGDGTELRILICRAIDKEKRKKNLPRKLCLRRKPSPLSWRRGRAGPWPCT